MPRGLDRLRRLEIAWNWYQCLIYVELILTSVASSAKRHNVPTLVSSIHFLDMSINKIVSANLMTVCCGTSPCGFPTLVFPVVQPGTITCWTFKTAGSVYVFYFCHFTIIFSEHPSLNTHPYTKTVSSG